MAKKAPAGAPAWMVTFADLMSLLVCFFVLILSFSILDMQQYFEVAGSIREAFGFQDEIVKSGIIEIDGTPFRDQPRNVVPVPLAVVTIPHSESPDASRGNLPGDATEDAYEELVARIVEEIVTSDAASDSDGLPDRQDGLQGQEGVGPGQIGDSGTLGSDGEMTEPGDAGDSLAQGLDGQEPQLGLDGEDMQALRRQLQEELENADPETLTQILAQMPEAAPLRRQVEEELAQVDPEALTEILQERVAREQLTEELTEALTPELQNEELQISGAGNSVTITFRDGAAFSSGRDQLQPEFLDALDRLAGVLVDQPGEITIAGHTDDIPISTARFRSNWELSVARSVSVVQYWDDQGLIPRERMVAVGYGETRPVADNNTADGRSQNRRIEVEIRVVPEPIDFDTFLEENPGGFGEPG